jgi:CheY-like chemotaxis protein
LNDKQILIIKIFLAAIVLTIAILRLVFFEIFSERMDSVFLLLVALAILIPVIPWQRLTHIKTSVFELELDRSQVKGAIEGLTPDPEETIDPEKFGIKTGDLHRKLEEVLKKKASQIKAAGGSRVLWIDDQPNNVTGERRLLRALGIEVITAISSKEAKEVLDKDNDFDLIISDVQREGDCYKTTGGNPIHDGVNFIVMLRKDKDPVISSLPVVFYAAYPWDTLVGNTRIARETQPEPKISNSIVDFLEKVFDVLSETRSKPTKIRIRPEKVATLPRKI